MTVKAHVDAVMTLLSSTCTVYVTRAADSAQFPYVVLHPDQGAAEASTLNLGSDRRHWRFQTTVAATGWEQAVTVAQKVEAALLDARPVVTGDSCGPIHKDVSLTVERDEDMPTPVFIARDVWSYYSHAA